MIFLMILPAFKELKLVRNIAYDIDISLTIQYLNNFFMILPATQGLRFVHFSNVNSEILLKK